MQKIESEGRQLELEESGSRYERKRRSRITERDRRHSVEIQQIREGKLEDREGITLEKWVRDQHMSTFVSFYAPLVSHARDLNEDIRIS